MFLIADILFLCILSTQAVPKLKPLTGNVEHVTVNEIKSGRLRTARSVQDCHFPHSLHFTFKVQEKRINLNLEKNVFLSRGVPTYVTSNGSFIREERNASNDFALYQDVIHGSALLVTCQDDLSYRLHGSFRHEGVMYFMSHSNVPEPTTQHLIQPSTETNLNFNDDTEIPPPEDEDVRRQMFGTISRQINDETPIPGGNIVELLFTVDKALYESFSTLYGSDEASAAIEMYAALLANQIDLFYCSVDMVDPTLSIKIYLAGVVIPEVGTDASWSSKSQTKVNGNTYLERLRILGNVKSWLSEARNPLPQHDHLMALSTVDLADTTKDPVVTGYEGRAFVGSVCYSTSQVSFTEVDGTRVGLTAAHELGHGLGANHDESTECPSSLKNIMAPSLASRTTLQYSEAQWTFSSCSVNTFKSRIDGGKLYCLKQHAFTGTEFEELQAKSLPGTVYSLTQQCQMYNGIWSSSCDNTILEEDCYNGFHCSTSSQLPFGCQQRHFPLYPLAGTPCGAPSENKWCYRGRCVKRMSTGTTTTTTTTTTPTTSPTICTTKSTTAASTSTSTTSSPTTTTSTTTTTAPPTTTSTSTTSTTTTTTAPPTTTSTSTTSTTTTTTAPPTTTSTSTTSTTTTTTAPPTTTTIEPCNKKKKCCIKVGKKKKCCKGTKCCKNEALAETECYKSCCAPKPTVEPTVAPCFTKKCCTKILKGDKLKNVCCKKAKCCKTEWGKDTKCCLTCKK